MPNRDLSGRCTTSFRPACTVWKSTFATTPELQNHFRNRWKFEAFSKSLQIHSKYPKSVPKYFKGGQMALNMIPNGLPKRHKIGLAPPRPPAPSKSCHWPPQMLPNGAHNVPESPQMSSKIVQNCSATAVLERRNAEENKSRRVSFDICRSLVANHRIIHSSSSREVGGRGGSL